MTGSYNERLSTTFAKNVRNGIQEIKASPDKIVYSDIFPAVRIQRGDASASLWSLEGQYASYLATSPTGTATGFGCSLMIIDDVIKNAYEANNAALLDAQWSWFTDTMLSRLEEGGKIIIIMTRWATGDLAGRAIKYFTEQGRKIRVISMKALQDDGTMLCDAVLSRRSYDNKVRVMGADIAAANYQQEPFDITGRLYTSFKTYDRIPRMPAAIRCSPEFIPIPIPPTRAPTGCVALSGARIITRRMCWTSITRGSRWRSPSRKPPAA